MKGKNIFTVALAVLAVVLLVFVLFFLPKKEKAGESSSSKASSVILSSTESQVSKESSFVVEGITVAEFLEKCDTVITGEIIKIAETDVGADYAFSVDKVYKGRNYTPNGYASVKGGELISLSTKCLFIGNKVDAKQNRYDYVEPFENAPWVFRVNEDGSLSHISGGNLEFCKELETLKIEDIKELCKKK